MSDPFAIFLDDMEKMRNLQQENDGLIQQKQSICSFLSSLPDPFAVFLDDVEKMRNLQQENDGLRQQKQGICSFLSSLPDPFAVFFRLCGENEEPSARD